MLIFVSVTCSHRLLTSNIQGLVMRLSKSAMQLLLVSCSFLHMHVVIKGFATELLLDYPLLQGLERPRTVFW